MSADVNQAAANKSDISKRIEVLEFPQSVEQQDISFEEALIRDSALAMKTYPAVFQQSLDFGKTFRMARRQNHGQTRVVFTQGGKRLHENFFFTLVRTACDQQPFVAARNTGKSCASRR